MVGNGAPAGGEAQGWEEFDPRGFMRLLRRRRLWIFPLISLQIPLEWSRISLENRWNLL